MNKDNALKTCESTCTECPLKYEVEHVKEGIVLRKEELIMKKDITQ